MVATGPSNLPINVDHGRVQRRDQAHWLMVATMDTTPEGLTPAQRALRARIAAYTLHARRDPRETTRPARAAFLARFERGVDPDGKLPLVERQRRAEAAKRAYFGSLALKSSKARSKR